MHIYYKISAFQKKKDILYVVCISALLGALAVICSVVTFLSV